MHNNMSASENETMTSPEARPSGRQLDQMRDIELVTGFSPYAEGSCLVKFGNTHVLCTASIEEKVPGFLRNAGQGWITAEYGMLPRATHTRGNREAARGKQSGRTQEIQRLIGRSLRAIVDLEKLGERTLKFDCDVIQADGGTRTASITGSYVALALAIDWLIGKKLLTESPLRTNVAAVSCGLYQGQAVLDLDYAEDSSAQADANFVLTGEKKIIEIQGTAEDQPFSRDEMMALLDLAEKGCEILTEKQAEALAQAKSAT